MSLKKLFKLPKIHLAKIMYTPLKLLYMLILKPKVRPVLNVECIVSACMVIMLGR